MLGFMSGEIVAAQTRPITPAEKALAAEAETERQELVNLERETARSIQIRNLAFFRRVYSDDFFATTAGGQLLDKTAYLRTVEISPIQYLSFVASDVHVRFFEDLAVVTSLWSMRMVSEGKTVSRQCRVTHMYVNGTHGWQAVSSQETMLPGGER